MYLTDSVFAQLAGTLDDIGQEIETLPKIRFKMRDKT
jgi:hypothetical protein